MPIKDEDKDNVSIREFIVAIVDERDKSYREKFHDAKVAVDAALTAQKEAVTTAFAAAKEASFEAKQSQNQYNVLHNDLQRKIEILVGTFVPKTEFKDIKDDIRILREWKSNVEGKFTVIIAVSSLFTFLLSIGVSVILFILSRR